MIQLRHVPDDLHRPHLLDLEVAQVLRRYARSGELDHVGPAEDVLHARPDFDFSHDRSGMLPA